ncbi:DUF1836 domain-containing protein [Bacillus sp. AFS041924]|uniref:DUF1836 domain-containing protein n=1 Tax=Bacillus sp. AFS041924 TaxID=2033503 RepID=UPI000BFBA98F|nr:DUF1836 domain-containing protein [Bacillus sp. AFS041924]PGS50596.1 hypothetical protein COC46_12660 [Bacillus sp. AFS041924]
MNNINEIIEQLELDKKITLEEIPNLDLYMDQVIQLFDNKFSKPNSDEKVLTKTMINNYSKAKLLFPIKNKKYTKNHIILISLIYHLKGALSINDINKTLNGLNQRVLENNQINIDDVYNSFLHLNELSLEKFKNDLQQSSESVNQELDRIDDESKEYVEKLLLITSFINMSNLYRSAAEKLITEMIEKRN